MTIYTTEYFIERALKIQWELNKKVHDYIETIYVSATKKVIIICPEGHRFEQTPNSHLNGASCPKCVGRNKTTEEFITQAKAIQLLLGREYDYSETIYEGGEVLTTIICTESGHGKFKQTPYNHLAGQGCPKCFGNIKSSISEFIEKAKKVQWEMNKVIYDYTLVNYINAKTKVAIGCWDKNHGLFKQTPDAHLAGKGCPKCIGRNKTTEEFIQQSKNIHRELHNVEYNYDKVTYINSDEKVTISCWDTTHGEFEQTPASHIRGVGCPKCGILKQKQYLLSNTSEFVKKSSRIHSEYDYSKVKYVNIDTPVVIICAVKGHGEFKQTPDAHLAGSGCPRCKESRGEKLIRKYLKESKVTYQSQFTFADCKNINKLSFDFGILVDEYLVGLIEYQGKQHYKAIDIWDGEDGLIQQQLRDKIKKDYCNNNAIPLLRIHYKNIKKINELLEEFINNL